MDQGSKSGLITPGMKANGEKIRPMAAVNFGMQMEIYMKENGKMIRPMGTAFIFMLMVHNMRAIGRMIFRMDRAWKAGKMEVGMREDTRKE